jgi:hypothetical protein
MKNSITDVPQIDRTKTLLENIHAAAEMYIVAIRKASTKMLEANRVLIYEEALVLPTDQAKRLDWFVKFVQRKTGIPAEAVALAFLATEVWDANDHVNDSWFVNLGWNGQGGGDYRIVDGKVIPVTSE